MEWVSVRLPNVASDKALFKEIKTFKKWWLLSPEILVVADDWDKKKDKIVDAGCR